MNSNKRYWPLISLYGIHDRVNTNPDYQRPPVWTRSQKRLLIDTILRRYDIPKLYWLKTNSQPDTYDVVDGQQRLRAIWEYFDGCYGLAQDADPVDGSKIASCRYKDLPDELRMEFDVYTLDVVVLDSAEEDEVREMFLRLQNGTTLRAQEKRNAYPGKMRDFVKELALHEFFSRVGFKNSRYTHDLVAAQVTCLEIAGEPTNTRNADLNRMYTEKQYFTSKSQEARSVIRTLKQLTDIFPEKTPELTRYNVIPLYCVMAELRRQFVMEEIKHNLHDWFIDFEQRRRKQEIKPQDEAIPEWVTYKEKISHSTDGADSIRYRMEFMMRDLLEAFPDLSRKDNQRNFTHLQRLAIFRRDKGICQVQLKCTGAKLTWDNWHCDHREPWSRGGPTTVSNGQVACPACNLAKRDAVG